MRYDDGLILVYQIEKQYLDTKKPKINDSDKIEEENLDDEEHDNKKKEIDSLDKNSKTPEEIMNELSLSIDYYNTFSLYYILLGHS